MHRLSLLLCTLFAGVAQAPAQDAAASAGMPPSCLDLVATYDAGAPTPPDTAFTLRLEPFGSAGGVLSYWGAQHSDDPSHPQFAEIETAYEALRPTTVFYEGPERPLAPTAEETIRLYGESGFVRWLANRGGAAVARLEPDPGREFGAVASAVGTERAVLFFVLREAARLRDRKGVTGLELDAAVSALLQRAAAMGLPVATLDDLQATYARHFTSPADWREVPIRWFDPRTDDAETGGLFMAAANRASSHHRDRHMAHVIAEAARRGERVLAVVGRDHVPKQAPALRCLAE
jgi:hypothetical protein